MADPRFYDNRGPFRLGELCGCARLDTPQGVDAAALVFDVAGLAQAGRPHLSFFHGKGKTEFLATKAGWCIVAHKARDDVPRGTVLLSADSVSRAFSAIARFFYPDHELDIRAQEAAIHPSAKLGEGIVLGPGTIIGPDAE